MHKLPCCLWQAAVSMCRADRRYPWFMKPLLAIIVAYATVTDYLAGRPISLVAIVMFALLLLEYGLTLKDQVLSEQDK